jgi:metal-sulfur cluster biosynthetic enzyme
MIQEERNMTRAASPAIAALRARITEALNTVIDPCSAAAGAPAGLVEMGLIRDLEIAEREEGLVVNIVVRVTHPSCFMAPFFLAQVQNLVHEVSEVAAVNASLDTGYDWTPADMSEAYKERLAQYRRARGLPEAWQ